jgi:NAD(P)-dependent dehydrogenase (short-subunit alcohol dehydrogenase family)
MTSSMRTIVVTGAAGGLGRVTALRFTKGGDRVFVCDIDVSSIADMRLIDGIAGAEVVDVGERSQIESFIANVRASAGRVDVLVNNVGIAGPRAPIEDVEPQEWLKTLNANLNAAFWSTRAVLPDMKRDRSGCILNVSTASVRTLPNHRSPYIVSKAALESLTLAVAREAGPYNIRCNAVRPGAMDNDRLNRILARVAEQQGKSLKDLETEQLRYVSMRTKVAMDEVAATLHFLASSAAAHITAQIIGVDGDVQWEE